MIATSSKAKRIEVGDRIALVAPMKHQVGGWLVSLDGFCVDSIHSTLEEAEASARRLLSDPDCPCWIARRA